MQNFGLTSNSVYSTYKNNGDDTQSHINDIYMLPNGQLAVVDGVYDIAQSIRCAIQLWLGEYDYNTSEGVPYRLLLGVQNVNNNLIDYQLRHAIFSVNKNMTTQQLQIYSVKSIQSVNFTVSKSTRLMTVNAVVLIANGQNIEVNV